ncbi:MAG: AAA family ATPase [Polyangiaceae bacterium]|nr:AAA family ATPase [Polyangiaceae bacterium]
MQTMSSSPYTITGTLHEGQRTRLLRGIRRADGLPVILKVLDPRRSRPRDLERLKHEYAIGEALDPRTAVKPLSLETYEGMPALVMEDFGGEALACLLGAPMPAERFLDLAIRIAAAVAALHAQGVIHKDLKPDNILINTATGQVKLADFELASRLPREHKVFESPRLIEGSLPYLAPEQTGRMNRAIDSRADLYALGVTFHEMLTGRLPFEARDPLEWVHCHVARAPRPPSAIVPELPEVLSAIVLKLLAKMAEDRYQTARGLQHDLERCLTELRAGGRIEPFPLAGRDVSDRLQIPQRLYGRGDESAALLSAFERVAGTGSPELVLVSGHAGVGKSALVQELHKPIARERGSFISGKFDQYERDVPYSTIVQAFRELVLEILAESEERLADFRERLRDALGVNGQIVVDVIPEVELVIGQQSPAPELPPVEAEGRFRVVFRHFLGVFARKDHPLALFLDDLQWADPASLGLLHDLMTHPDVRHLLVIGAYRDNEVSPSHPLMRALDRIRSEGARVSDIVLGPLSGEDLAALVSDTLHCSREEAAALSSLIHEKTGGNPFFAIHFLTDLHEGRLIELDWRAGAFRWDMARIRAEGSTDNVIDLMVGKLARLPAGTRGALEQLACLGSVAEVAILAALLGRPEEATDADLREAVRAGLVLRADGAYRFLHDRIQEAAYSLIPEGERAATHLEIGRLLWSRTPPGELEEKVFDIVRQLDRGVALITSREERERVAELDLLAGKRAHGATAYASALKYFAAGSALLAEDRWERRYELTFALELHRAECEYLTGDLASAEERLSTLSRRAAGLVDVAAVTCARVALYTTLDRSDRSVDVCLEYLRLVGVEWSPHPTDEEVQREYEQMRRRLGSRPAEELVDLPPVADPLSRASMDVLAWAISPAMLFDENLLCLVVVRLANLSLEHGNSDGSCLAYVWLGMLLGSRFGDYQAGFRFGKLSVDLVERRGLLRFKARVYLGFGHMVIPWARPVRAGVELVRRARDAAQGTGDLLYASYACASLIMLLLAEGDPLGEVRREAEGALDFVRRTRFGVLSDTITGQRALIRALQGLTPSLSSFSDAELDEDRFERRLEGDPRLSFAARWYWIHRLEARLYANEYAAAIEAARRAEPLVRTAPPFFAVAEYHFYGALARAAHHDAAPAEERARHREALAAHHERLAAWAESCPENFGCRAALVEAEIARVGGEWDRATQLYEQAIRRARENGFVQCEALAYETAARSYRARGFELIADAYLREARDRYLRWGADGKVRQLERLHPRLVERRPAGPAATLALGPEQLDLLSVAKASQTISGEIVLDRLVRTLLAVVLEQGGAQRACLLLRQGGSFSIGAEAALAERGAEASILGPLPADFWRRVPSSLVHYVQRTGERVILSDAAADAGRFSGDEYLARRRPRSVLCMPILRQAEVVGLLYLENDLLAGAFTPDRLVALELLATQAAIALEKAELLGKEQAARAAAEEAERRSAFLAEAGALLAGSLDYMDTLARLGRLCVRFLADWCVIDVVEGGEIHRLSGAHRDPAKEPLLEELRRRYPPSRDTALPSARVLRTGQPLVLSEISDEDIRATCADELHARLVRALGTRTGLVVPLAARGQTLGALILGSGAPGRRYSEADLDLVQEAARRAAMAIDNAQLYRKAQRAIRVRDEFLSVASHELNTPMTSLSLSLEAIDRALSSDRPLDPVALRRMTDRALRQAARLTRLNRELLDMSQIQADRLPLALADVPLGAVVRDVVGRLKLDLERAGCPISIQSSGEIVGRWDRPRLDQIVTNLLSNAMKFGAGKPIDISIREEAGTARVSVRDHGIGIDPALAPQIFERFERAVSERHYGGLGLGLYVSRRIAEAHGGTIRVQSEPGAGSTFTLELPRAGPPGAAGPGSPPD